MRLDSQNYTPRARRKAVYAGGNEKSHSVGAKSLAELAEWDLSTPRVSELTIQAGKEMKALQMAQVEAYHQQEATRSLSVPREPSPETPENLPQVGVVEMDGGRMRMRQENSARGVTSPHWGEFQAGCVVRLQSESSDVDPRPEVPRLFLNRPKVHKLVSQLHRQRSGVSSGTNEGENETSIGELIADANLAENRSETNPAVAVSANASATPQPIEEGASNKEPRGPVRLQRTCVATLEGTDACGRILAAEAAQRGLHHAHRKGFVGDGQTGIWSAFERYFERLGYIPILDFIHLLSYVYSFAMAVGPNSDDGWQLHVKWITMLWKGRAKDVLSEWREWGAKFEVPTDRALPDNDPRRPIQRGITYLGNNLGRVDYPRYRRQGLPVTSTLMESLVKEFNLRVKGTEKFWNDPEGAEAILMVRAALLSEDGRFDAFFANRPGCRFRRRSTRQQNSTTPAVAT